MQVRVPILILLSITLKVQKRLTAILMDLVVRFPRVMDKPCMVDVLPLRPLSWFVARSKHQVVVFNKVVSCVSCHQSCSGPKESKVVKAWLLSDCPGEAAVSLSPGSLPSSTTHLKLKSEVEVWVGGRRLHPAHNLSVFRGLYFCCVCGSIAAQRAVNLYSRCAPPTPQGKKNLRRLMLGLLPRGTPWWPDQGRVESQAKLVL